MNLFIRIILFVLAVAAFAAAIMASSARAADPHWPAEIKIELHRVTPHHHRHHFKQKRKEVMPLAGQRGFHPSISERLHTVDIRPPSATAAVPSVYYRLNSARFFDPEYVEWLETELLKMRGCRCRGGQ